MTKKMLLEVEGDSDKKKPADTVTVTVTVSPAEPDDVTEDVKPGRKLLLG